MVSQFPFGPEFVVLRDAVNQLLEESFVPSGGSRFGMSNGARALVRPLPLDLYATEDEVVVIAALPGMNPNDLDVTINQNVLTLTGSVPSATESEQGKNATWYIHELWSGRFQRSVPLPFEVDSTKAEATFEHGIARIVIPKAERAKPHKIAIKATSGRQEAIGAGATS